VKRPGIWGKEINKNQRGMSALVFSTQKDMGGFHTEVPSVRDNVPKVKFSVMNCNIMENRRLTSTTLDAFCGNPPGTLFTLAIERGGEENVKSEGGGNVEKSDPGR